jgi:ABC-type transport system substrate-binding protein
MRAIKGRKIWATSGLLFLVAALVGALVLIACAGGGGGGGGGGNETPPRPWVVKYGFAGGGIGGYIGIDPAGSGDMFKFLMGDTLSGFNVETREPVLFLATREEVNWEEKYTDHWIRQGIKFQNGDPLTAEDVKFSFDRTKNADIVGAAGAVTANRYIGNVEVIDDYHVRIHWNYMGSQARKVNPFQPTIVPKNYIEEVGWEEWAQRPVLTGPLKVVDWERDIYVHFEKAYPEGHWYWGNVPNYDEFIVKAVPEPSTRIAMLKTGELDIASIPTPLIPEVNADPNLTLVMAKYVTPWCILFCDYDNPGTPMSDPLVRKAVSLAIDRAGIAKNVLHDAAEPWGNYYAPYMLGYKHRDPDPYDPDQAKKLLAEAGYPDGFDTYFHYPQDQELVAQAVIGSLATVGIRAEGRPYEVMTWYEKYRRDQLDGMSYTPQPLWMGEYYPDGTFYQEIYGWGDPTAPVSGDIPELVEAFNRILDTKTEEEMAAAAQAAEELVLDELGYKLVVWAMHSASAYGPTIENWDPAFPLFTATYNG